VFGNKILFPVNLQPFSKSSTFQTVAISSTLDGQFPLKAEDQKRTTPRQKLMIRIIKSSKKF